MTKAIKIRKQRGHPQLAETGCSANETAAVAGHVSLEEVARYTWGAKQKRLAHSAMDRLVRGQPEIKIPNQPDSQSQTLRRFGEMGQKQPEKSIN